MAQYGGEQYGREERQSDEYGGGRRTEEFGNQGYSTKGGEYGGDYQGGMDKTTGGMGGYSTGGTGTDYQTGGVGGYGEDKKDGIGGFSTGGTGTDYTTGGVTGTGYGEEKKEGTGILQRSGSGSSSSSEDDGQGGRRKKKGLIGKIKEKLPGGDRNTDELQTSTTTNTNTNTNTNTAGGGEYGHTGEAGEQTEEKKGFLGRIKEKLPGHGQ